MEQSHPAVPMSVPPMPVTVPSSPPPQPPTLFAPPAPPAPPSPPPPVYLKPPKPIGNPGDWFTDDDYPAVAKRAGKQGRVGIRLMVDSKGVPFRCEVVSSSGSPSLDNQTCRIAMLRARFISPVDMSGTPLAFSYPITTRWVLEEDENTPVVELGDVTVDLTKGPWSKTVSVAIVDIDIEGRAVKCRSGMSTETDEEACAEYEPGILVLNPVKRGGRAVGATVTVTRTVRIQTPSLGKAAPATARKRKTKR